MPGPLHHSTGAVNAGHRAGSLPPVRLRPLPGRCCHPGPQPCAPPPPAPGKTSVAHQFVEGKFVECYEPTVESTYNNMVMVGKDEFQLQQVDTAGQDEYTILPHSFVIGTHGYILVYSVTSLRGFQVVKTLHNKLYGSRGNMRMPVVLVGSNADLALQSREVKTDEGKKLAESWGASFLESLAKESQVTQGIFLKIIEEIDRVDNSNSGSNGCCL
ncbi:GTPase RhebL1 isoform X1 [Columba livia]|uniref:GTPase RhebL1 isoform X1 n=1 Tax=Columba livia TaxID=8932 RepID=UPI0031BA17AE